MSRKCTWTQAVMMRSNSVGTCRCVMLVASICATADGRFAIPGHTLAKAVGESERQVRYAVRALVAAGELILVQKGGGKSHPSEYRIDLPRCIKWVNPNRSLFRAPQCRNSALHSVHPIHGMNGHSPVAGARVKCGMQEAGVISHAADQHESPFRS